MNTYNEKEKVKHTTIRISEKLYQKIEQLAKEQKRSITQQISFMCEDWIKIKEK